MSGILYFDGRCGMCTRSVNTLRRFDRRGVLRTEPYQRPGTAQRLGVAESDMGHSVWWLDDSGAVYQAAEAFNAAVSEALGTRIPLVFYRIPGIRQLQERIYHWVATHRYKFPGTTPRCESDPAACSA